MMAFSSVLRGLQKVSLVHPLPGQTGVDCSGKVCEMDVEEGC
jgi:hypothetical protein